MQVRRGAGKGDFDARSVAHGVIVPFDAQNKNPLGGSPSPYLNNPLRIPEISAQYRGAQKNKEEWDYLCFILDQVEERQSPAFTKELFVQVLLEIRRIQLVEAIVESDDPPFGAEDQGMAFLVLMDVLNVLVASRTRAP